MQRHSRREAGGVTPTRFFTAPDISSISLISAIKIILMRQQSKRDISPLFADLQGLCYYGRFLSSPYLDRHFPATEPYFVGTNFSL